MYHGPFPQVTTQRKNISMYRELELSDKGEKNLSVCVCVWCMCERGGREEAMTTELYYGPL